MRKTLLVTLATTLIAVTAIAADPSPPPSPPGMGSGPATAGRADDMALLLGLRPDQRPALDAFLGRIAPPAPDNGDHGGAPDGSRMQAMMEAAQQYRAGLTPDQQARFDALERLRHGPHMGRRGRWGGPPPQQ